MSPAGGHCHWAIANWLVPASGAHYHDGLRNVFAMDEIKGYVFTNRVGCLPNGSMCLWKVGFVVNWSYYQETTFASVDISNEAVGAALEGYNIDMCSQWPSSKPATFATTNLRQACSTGDRSIPINMSPFLFGPFTPSCAYSVTRRNGSPSTIDISY
jgi:hypothetical protein